MRLVRLALVPVMIAAVCVAPSTLRASGCNQDIVVPIQFTAGSTCWKHNGPGTTFNGQFAAHQHITASAIGEIDNSDGKRNWVTTGPWQLSVTGPGGFSASDDGNGHPRRDAARQRQIQLLDRPVRGVGRTGHRGNLHAVGSPLRVLEEG